MPEYLAPGVFVEEVPGGAKPIAGVSTSTIGMIGVTERGPVNEPTLVTNYGSFTRVFGGLLDQRVHTDQRFALPYAIQGAFDNGAGRIYVDRIVGPDATFGSVDLAGNAAVRAAATALSARAPEGATVLQIDDGANLGAGDLLLLSDGPRSEYVTTASAPTLIGVAVTGHLHSDRAATTAVTLQTAPTTTGDLTAGVTGDMAAGGGLALDGATTGALSAGDILRIRQTDDDTVTEYVTITTGGAADFDEGSLLFDHPQATVAVDTVTVTDDTTSTTIDADATAGDRLVSLASTAGLADGALIAIGPAAARELHVVRTIVSQLSIATSPTTAIHAAGVEVLRQVPLLRVHAKDLGGWSDRVRVRTRPSPMNESVVTAAAAIGDSPITVSSTVGLHPGSVVSIRRGAEEQARQRVVAVDHGASQIEVDGGAAADLQVDDVVTSQEYSLTVELLDADGRVASDEAFPDLAVDPTHPRYGPTIVGRFDRNAGRSEAAGLSDLVRLSDLTRNDAGDDLVGSADTRLATPFDGVAVVLDGGDDDLDGITDQAYQGAVPDLERVDDISIVAAPGQSSQVVQNALITHCELMRYRIAVLDSGPAAGLADVQTQRQRYDTTRAALYHPWLVIADPFGQPGDRLAVPPSGHVCGAFARTDNERGVHKAPANVVVRNILDLETVVTTGEQEILNPRGINVIRDFSNLGRARRIWGSRTMTSDPEWIYVPVRRLFLFIEKSIERGTQFAVFEPNSQALWATVQRSLTNFLTAVWRDGALAGASPEEAFFVDVGLNTMTQADIDAGRLIVNVGIAPVKPAEFVIFRISQKTAGAA